MRDTRLSADDLDLFISYAYGGQAVREGRKAQAHAVANLLRGKSLDECRPSIPSEGQSKS